MKRLYAWGPVCLWMVVIFLLSSRSRIQVAEEEAINFLVFKTLHVFEYALLYALSYRAVRFEKSHGQSSWSFTAFIISILYAGSDEIHQTLVPTREGHPRDVIIDAAGILLSWITIQYVLPILPKKLLRLVHRLLLV